MNPWILSSQNFKNLKNYPKLLHLTLLKPHRLHHLLPPRPSLQKNLNLSGNISYYQRVFSCKETQFLTPPPAKDVELSDLDLGLQQELRSSPQARAGFLALNLTCPEALRFDPDKVNSRRLTSARSDLSLTFNIQIDTMDTRMKNWNPRLTTKHSYFEGYSYRIYNEQPRHTISFYMKNKDPE